MKKTLLYSTIIALSFCSVGCGLFKFDVDSVIRIGGSDTMYELNNSLAEAYMKANPGKSIYVFRGGTKDGFQKLISGEYQISAASRSLKADEAKEMAKNFSSVGISILIAKDALSVYLNLDNEIKNLSLQELKEIFTGEKKNWKDFGGSDSPIIVLTRTPNSGTYTYFREHILPDGEYASDALTFSTTEEIIAFVNKEKAAIGYGGIGFGENVYHCKINGVEPITKNVVNDSYPLSRYLYYYTTNTPQGEVKEYIDWVISGEGQKIIRDLGYVPLWLE